MRVPVERVLSWLAARARERRRAIQEAASELLADYRREWPDLIPVELHRLAYTLRAEIIPLVAMKADANLVPTTGGFRVYVNGEHFMGRYRTAIAHELAHSLFYELDGEVPRRFVGHSKQEEYFCFDVARRVLAPDWHLDALDVAGSSEPQTMFGILTGQLCLSRPVAARVMLDDYELAKGVAGRWVRAEEGWKLEKNSACASPSLKRADRAPLREMARAFLKLRTKPDDNYTIVSVFEQSGQGAFVMVVQA